MDLQEMLPNLIAMIASLIAAIMLFKLAYKMRGGQMGKVVNLLVIGIFFSVTVHAGFELAELFGLINTEALFVVMGVLLSLGSILFIYAGYVGLRMLKS